MDLVHERVPPHDIEAEISVLGCMLLDNDTVEPIKEILEADYFYRTAHRIIFTTILNLHREEGQIDIVILKNKLKNSGNLDKIGGAGYLMEIEESVPIASNFKQYAKIVKEKGMLRMFLEMTMQLGQRIYANEEGSTVIINDCKEQTNEMLALLAKGRKVDDLKMNMEDVMKAFSLIETPFENVNDALEGGIPDGKLIIVGAETDNGKTAFVLDLLNHISIELGLESMYFGAHTKKEEIVARMLCSKYGIKMKDFKRGKVGDKAQNCLETVGKAPVGIVTEKDELDVMSIISDIRSHIQAKGKLGGAIFIENLEFLTLKKRFSGTEIQKNKAKIDNILGLLKGLTEETGVSIIVSVQARSPENGFITIDDLFGSSGIKHIADLVVLVSIGNSDRKTQETIEKGRVEIVKGVPHKLLELEFNTEYRSWTEKETTEKKKK